MKKFNLIGIPYQIIIGKNTGGDFFEFKEVDKKPIKITLEKIIEIINKEILN